MLVPARILASDTLMAGMDEGVLRQITNVACLPGIVEHALCMPDGHWGYGFPIGGVAAFDLDRESNAFELLVGREGQSVGLCRQPNHG